MQTEQLDDKSVKSVYDEKASLQPNINAVLDAGNNVNSRRANLLHDYLHKKTLKKTLNLHHDDIILDFGTGVGRLSTFLSPYVKKIIGVDASKQMIQVAQENCKASNIEYILLDTEKIPIEDNTFDKAFSYWVLASISNAMLDKIIPEIYRLIKPNGLFVFYEQVKKESVYEKNIHKKRTVDEYKTLCERHGFQFLHTEAVQRTPSYAMHFWKKHKFLPKICLPFFYFLEQKTLYRKQVNVDYYTNVFVFKK